MKLHPLSSLAGCLLAVCLLAGCGSNTSRSTSTAKASPPAVLTPEEADALYLPAASEAVPPTPAEAGITYAVELQTYDHQDLSEDGVQLTSTHYVLPYLQAYRADGAVIDNALTPAEEQAMLVTETFNACFRDWTEPPSSLAADAADQYAQDPELFSRYGMYYEDTLTCTVYATDHLVSVKGDGYYYYGGAHGLFGRLSRNFDLDAGAFIIPAAIAQDELAFESAVTEELGRQARQKAAESDADISSFYWKDYMDILADWPNYAVSFDLSGMTVSYSSYELGAAGPHSFLLDRAFLEPYLSDYGRALLGYSEG